MARTMIVTVIDMSEEGQPNITSFGPFATEDERQRWLNDHQRAGTFGENHFLIDSLARPFPVRDVPMIGLHSDPTSLSEDRVASG
jgi:hypothetical protein